MVIVLHVAIIHYIYLSSRLTFLSPFPPPCLLTPIIPLIKSISYKSTMPVDVIDPWNDKRFTHEYATLNNHRYHYLLAVPPSGSPSRTVFLIHGWPDISMGWRYQIPLLLSLNCRVVVPDMLGFGRTDAPPVPPNPLSAYGLKQAADDIAELARQLGAGRIILGGHDWGGAVAYRTCLYHPELVSQLFVVCTPYTAPAKGGFMPLAVQVDRFLPNFRYQLQLASGEVQKVVNTKETIAQFLQGIYGGQGEKGETIFSVQRGVHFENLGKIGPSPLMTKEETEYYVQEYQRNGLDGTLNWYKTTKVNYDDELQIENSNIEIPVLFILATQDAALPESMSKGMEANLPHLTRRTVEASHWALWQKPTEVNDHITKFLNETGALGGRSTL